MSKPAAILICGLPFLSSPVPQHLATQQRSEAETSQRRATGSRVPRLIILGDKVETKQVTPRTAPV
ncbi:unnamed protein product [Ectocarpus sp. 6 AP-2014]